MMTNININNKRSAFLNLQEKLKDIPDYKIIKDDGYGLSNLHQYERLKEKDSEVAEGLERRQNLWIEIDEELRRLDASFEKQVGKVAKILFEFSNVHPTFRKIISSEIDFQDGSEKTLESYKSSLKRKLNTPQTIQGLENFLDKIDKKLKSGKVENWKWSNRYPLEIYKILLDPTEKEENTENSKINVLLRKFEDEINKYRDKQQSDLIEENEVKVDRYRASITMPVEPNSARTLSSSSSLEQSVTPVSPTQSIFSSIASLAQSAVAAIKSMASRTILWNIQTNDEKGLPVFKGKVDDLDTYFQKEAEIHFQKFMVQKKESIFLGLGQQLVDHFHVSCGDGVLYSGSKKQIETRLAEAYQTAISEQQPTQAKLIDETRQDFQSITGKKKTSELFKEKFKESINPAQELSDEEDKWRGPGHPRD